MVPTSKKLTFILGMLLFSTMVTLYGVNNVAFFSSIHIDLKSYEPDTYTPHLLNDRSRDIIGATPLNVPGFITPQGLTGKGQIVGLADSGLDTGSIADIHPDLRSTPGKMPKVVMLKSWAGRETASDTNGHGTHMAATIAGTGAASGGQYHGVAPEASIYFQSIMNAQGKLSPPSDLERLFKPAYAADVRVHVNGWGGGANKYLNSAAQTDHFVRKNPDFLVVFGAGNDGPKENSITAEANSKNALTVGASVSPRLAFDPVALDTYARAQFSSRGPAGDGRIKPELLAPGTSIISARSRLVEGNLPGLAMYNRMQGTSMAAAVTGGAASILREFLEDEMSMGSPSAALMKAALINGARVTEKGPGNDGFGILDLTGTILALKEETYKLIDQRKGLKTGVTETYYFDVTTRQEPFKVTLSWLDPAAQPGASHALINNLDLIVIAPDGNKIIGNHFLKPKSADRINNIEQVYIPNPTLGKYTVIVKASDVKQSSGDGEEKNQDYALCYGQPLVTGTISGNKSDNIIEMSEMSDIDMKDKQPHYVLNEKLSDLERQSLFPGARLMLSNKHVYLWGRYWREEGVLARKSDKGLMWLEVDPMSRKGGYFQEELNSNVIVNNEELKDISGIPPGVEISASINPVTQTIWHAKVNYIQKEGFVSNIEKGTNNLSLMLIGDKNKYILSKTVEFIYKDYFKDTEQLDMAFGTGALDDLEHVLPGVAVNLIISPSTGEVQCVLVKRQVIVGQAVNVDVFNGKVQLDRDRKYKFFPGAETKINGKKAGLENLQPGDYVTAVLLPDTGDILGLSAYTNIVYGKVVYLSEKNKEIYITDHFEQLHIYHINPETSVRRWGLETDLSAISTGSWVRVITSPNDKDLWRLDIAEIIEDKSVTVTTIGTGAIASPNGTKYIINNYTDFLKDGYKISQEDLLPGDKVSITSLLVPGHDEKVLMEVKSNSPKGVPKPTIAVSTVPSGKRYLIVGNTTADKLYLWQDNKSKLEVQLKSDGSFSHMLDPLPEDSLIKMVAINKDTGAVNGQQLKIPTQKSGKFSDVNGHWAEADIIKLTSRGLLGGYPDGAFRPNNNINRVEIVSMLTKSLGWDYEEQKKLSYKDMKDIPIWSRSAVTTAVSKGIITGYPGGYFQPGETVTRGMLAVIIDRIIMSIRPVAQQYEPVKFSDCNNLPGWMGQAIPRVYTADILKGRYGRYVKQFAPNEPVTRADSVVVLNRLLAYLQK